MQSDVDERTGQVPDARLAHIARACAQLRGTLHRNGLRCTPHRLAIVALLASQPQLGHLTAGEVRGALAEADHHLDNATVYRALAVLVDIGTVHVTTFPDGATSYGLATAPHHHAVCTICGQVREIAAQPLEELVERAERASRYRINDSVLLSGTCPDCQDPTDTVSTLPARP